MRLSLGLGMQQVQTMGQRLEQKLEQKLSQQLVQTMTLAQYLVQEDIINGLIRWTTENNAWAQFNKDGFNFEYAKVPYAVAKPIADIAGFGFAHCQFNTLEELTLGGDIARAKGQWTLFVVDDIIPNGLEDFVALHERGEELSIGDHYFASQLEFAYANKMRKIAPYINLIDKEYPSKFVDLTQRVMFPILPDELRDFLEKEGRNHFEELDDAEELIENYPIPVTVLRKMEKYERITERACSLIREAMGKTQDLILKTSKSPDEFYEKAARIANNVFRNNLKGISPEVLKVSSHNRIENMWNQATLTINHDISFHSVGSGPTSRIRFPTTFKEAYQLICEGKDFVEPVYTVEDKQMRDKRTKGQETHGYALSKAG